MNRPIPFLNSGISIVYESLEVLHRIPLNSYSTPKGPFKHCGLLWLRNGVGNDREVRK